MYYTGKQVCIRQVTQHPLLIGTAQHTVLPTHAAQSCKTCEGQFVSAARLHEIRPRMTLDPKLTTNKHHHFYVYSISQPVEACSVLQSSQTAALK